jgi:hypothetical protein
MNKVCVVMGVGPGNGEALVRRSAMRAFRLPCWPAAKTT